MSQTVPDLMKITIFFLEGRRGHAKMFAIIVRANSKEEYERVCLLEQLF